MCLGRGEYLKEKKMRQLLSSKVKTVRGIIWHSVHCMCGRIQMGGHVMVVDDVVDTKKIFHNQFAGGRVFESPSDGWYIITACC